MKILIKNINLISMSEKRKKYEENIDVLINGNKIEKIDKNIVCTVDKIIDGTGKILMPGFINTHAHVSMSIFRETLDGLDLQTWLNDNIWPMEAKLNDEDIYYASYLSFLEMIKNGTTTINDMYFMTDNIIKAALDSKVRLQTSITMLPSYDTDVGLNKLKELIVKYKDNELISFNSAPHSLYVKKEDDLKKYLSFAHENNLNVHMHFCENIDELSDIKGVYGKYHMDILEEYFKDYKLILAHCVQLSNDDIKRLSKFNVSVSHCPISNLKLGCGVANIKTMIENNINVTLGTVGQGSGCNLDMFETMKIAALLQNGINCNPKVLCAYDVLKMATVNGAIALGLENKVGKIEEGYLADIILLDCKTEKMQPINNVFSDIVYNANGNNVVTTIINGNILMEDRKLNMDFEQIYEKCKKIINRIKLG